MFWRRISITLLSLLTIAIPMEHKYDKLFRFFSLKLVPPQVFLPSFFDKKIYFYPSDLIALFLFFIAIFAFRVPLSRFFLSRGSIYLWIVFFFTILSITFSPLSHYAIPYIRLLQLLTPILLFSFVAHSFSAEEKSKITALLFGCLAISALIQSLIAIGQYTIQGPLHLRILGEPNHFSSFGTLGHPWIFDGSGGEANQIIRPSGTLPHANVLGGFLSVSILGTYSFFTLPRWRLFFACLIPLLFFAMSLTFSRSALFSWALGTVIWFALSIKMHKEKFFRDRSLQILAVSLLVSLLFSFIVLKEPIINRGGIVNYNELVRGSDALRLRYQNIALQIIKDHPLYGAGFNQLSIAALKYVSDDPIYLVNGGTHNIYLYLAAETGLISLASFLLFIVLLYWAAFKTPLTPALASLIAIFTAFLFIGGCDFYPLLFQQGKLPFFLGAGLLAANANFKKTSVLLKAI